MAASIDAHVDADQALLEQLVDINSGTMHFSGIEAVKDILVPQFQALGFEVHWVPMETITGRAGDELTPFKLTITTKKTDLRPQVV